MTPPDAQGAWRGAMAEGGPCPGNWARKAPGAGSKPEAASRLGKLVGPAPAQGAQSRPDSTFQWLPAGPDPCMRGFNPLGSPRAPFCAWGANSHGGIGLRRRSGRRRWAWAGGGDMCESGLGCADPELAQNTLEVHLRHKGEGPLVSLALLATKVPGEIQRDHVGAGPYKICN